jgi:hypothetical protein
LSARRKSAETKKLAAPVAEDRGVVSNKPSTLQPTILLPLKSAKKSPHILRRDNRARARGVSRALQVIAIILI